MTNAKIDAVQNGLVIAPRTIMRRIECDHSRTLRLANMACRKSKSIDALIAECHANGWLYETIFDAAHGRRYLAFVYRNPGERAACWDCLTETQ